MAPLGSDADPEARRAAGVAAVDRETRRRVEVVDRDVATGGSLSAAMSIVIVSPWIRMPAVGVVRTATRQKSFGAVAPPPSWTVWTCHRPGLVGVAPDGTGWIVATSAVRGSEVGPRDADDGVAGDEVVCLLGMVPLVWRETPGRSAS